MSAKNWTSEVPDTSGMTDPVRCTPCGKTYDLATVTKAQLTTCRCGVSISAEPLRSWKSHGGPRHGDFWCPGGQLHEPAGGAVNLMWRAPCCDHLVVERADTPTVARSFK